MKLTVRLFLLIMLASSGVASGQSFDLRGSAGPTLIDGGYSLTAGAGFSPISRVTLVGFVERTHLSSQLRSDGRGGVAGYRGGTLTLGAAEVQVALFPRDRIGPYALAGFAAGMSRPNVTATFPDPVRNDVRAMFFGGGINVPLSNRLSVFADARMMIGAEAGELLAVVPVRGGLAWRF
jgi:hypothetical protein